MSSLIVEVSEVKEVEKHPNADKMCILSVKGWKVCSAVDAETGQPRFKVGDKVVFIPPDVILQKPFAEKIGVYKYLKQLPKNPDGTRPEERRVGVANLRGVKSFGIAIEPEDPSWPVGHDVAEFYNITKWEPPLECKDGDAAPECFGFHKYTDIENLENYPDLIEEGTEVVFTEKIHGMNCRLGYVVEADENGTQQHVWMAGSHAVRRKELDKHGRPSVFWMAFTPNLQAMMRNLAVTSSVNVMVFGELYGFNPAGKPVQDMTYGMKPGDPNALGFKVFDIAVNGKYLDFDVKAELCALHNIPMVPVLYRGPFNVPAVQEHISGPTTLCDPATNLSKFKGREGIVITPVREYSRSTEKKHFDRVILKAVSFEYRDRKEGTEFH